MTTRALASFLGLLSLAATAPACAAAPADSAGESEAFATDASDLFGASARLDVSIRAPLGRLINGFQTAKNALSSVPGVLTVGGTPLNVTISVRGNTSPLATECSFPKMKVKIDDGQNLSATPFKGHKKLKINTHCGERPITERTKFGRVANQVSPAREELAYRIVRALAVPTYQTRLASITWVDPEAGAVIPGAAPGFMAPPASMVRDALFIESTDDAAQRFVKEGLIPQGSEPIAVSTTTNVDTGPMDQNRIATIQLAEASIGNYDWFFEPQGGTGQKALWNIDLFGVPTQVLPILQDFDLSNIVTLRTTPEHGVGTELDRALKAFPHARLAPIAASLLMRRDAVESELAASPHADAEAVNLARGQITAFFAKLTAIAAGDP